MDSPLPPMEGADPRVEAWIEAATQGLAEDARRRVRDEILDHVAESVDERRASGATTDQAVAAAVAALGDAAHARRALRRANLRPSEARLIGALSRPQPRWVVALYLLGPPAFAAANAGSLESPGNRALFIVFLLGMIAGSATQFSLARTLARRGRLRAALAADVLGRWCFYASLVVGTNVLTGDFGTLSIAIYALFLLLAAFFLWRMWPKVRPYRGRPS